MPGTLSISARLLAQALDVPYYLVSDLAQVSVRFDERGSLTVDDTRALAINGARLPALYRDQLNVQPAPPLSARLVERIPAVV